jgi:hypothetical protein
MVVPMSSPAAMKSANCMVAPHVTVADLFGANTLLFPIVIVNAEWLSSEHGPVMSRYDWFASGRMHVYAAEVRRAVSCTM